MNLYKFHSNPDQLDGYAISSEKVPLLTWEKYSGQPAELHKREALWATDAKLAYLYACYVLKDRFPAGEAAIAQDAEYAYKYARHVLKGKFPAGEAAIARSAEHACWYAEFTTAVMRS